MEQRKLLPDEARSPWLLIAVHLLPQALLALILWRAWGLVGGEIGPQGRGAFLTIVGMQLALVLAATVAGIALWRSGRQVEWPLALGALVLNIAFLWAGLAQNGSLVPATVSNWILDDTQLAFALVCLVAPALFYCGLCIASLSLPGIKAAADIGGSVVALLLVPAGWYVYAVLGHRFFRVVDLPFAVGMTIFIVSTALVAFAFFRLLLWLYRLARGTIIPAILAGIALPFGGLALNSTIPFPVDLQYWPVYALTAVNAVVLLLPFRAEHPWRVAVWFARWALYPFTLYFFLLFLPFLPLTIPAMIAAGAGFLILTPTFLFVIHSRILFDETRILGQSLSWSKLVALLAIALALLPVGYVVRAAAHRVALMRAVTAVYSPDLAVERPAVSPRLTRLALTRLQRMKDGVYLPFLSESYNRIVFNGMILPDHKVKQISEAICGEDLSRRETLAGRGRDGGFMEVIFDSRRQSRSWTGTTMPPRNVSLVETRITSLTGDGPLAEARVELELQNDNRDLAEYVATLELPPSVWVSGFELDVAGQWVPGRIFDRKSALWVYHMIRDTTRRDPGLLVYTDPRHLQLSVFPFSASERRRCAIHLLFLDGDSTSLAIGNRRIVLKGNATAPAPVVQVPLPDNGTALYIPREQMVGLPVVQRPVCAHFLLDASAQAVETLPVSAQRVEEFLKRNPWVTHTAATAVNFESAPICPPGTPPERLLAEIRRVSPDLKTRGGRGFETAIRRVLFKELTGAAPSEFAALFVVVADTNIVSGLNLAEYSEILPDVRVIDDSDTVVPAPAAVVSVRGDDGWALLSPATGGWVFGGAKVAAGSQLIISGIRVSPDSRMAAIAAIRRWTTRQVLYPSTADQHRGTILNRARTSGILAPATAYMVVENTAQWKALEQAEKKSLASNSALEFDEFKTPEPSVWLVMAGIAGWLFYRYRCSSAHRA